MAMFNKYSPYVRGLNVGLLMFSLLVLGGAGYYLSANQTVNYKTGASNVRETTTGTLIAKDSKAFDACKGVTTDYALIGAIPETSEMAKENKEVMMPSEKGKPSTVPVEKAMPETDSMNPACTPLVVQADIADPLVGKRVSAVGTKQDGVFYATSLTELSDNTPQSDNYRGAPAGVPVKK